METSSFDSEYQVLLGSFEVIAQIKSPLKRRFLLDKIAGWHGLPRSEFRQLFQLFLFEKAQK